MISTTAMTARSILFTEGKKAAAKLKKLTPKATGKTRGAIKPQVRKDASGHRLEIITPASFIFAIRGRGPGKMPPENSIAQWLDLKGLSEKSYGIRKKIAVEGTKLWMGKGKDNLKTADKILDDMAGSITSKLADLQVKETLKKIDGN